MTIDDDDKHHRVGGGRRILHRLNLGRERGDDRGALSAAHLPHDEVVAHHLGDDQQRAERDAGLGKRDDDVAHDLPAARAGVVRGLDHAWIDFGKRIGDRTDHQDGAQIHIGDDDREIGEQQEVERLRRQAQVHQRLVEHAVAAEKRNPGDGPDDRRSEKRNGAQQEQHGPDRAAAHVKDQKVGDVESDEERGRPDDRRELQSAAVKPERRRVRDQVVIIVQQESRIDSDAVMVPEADHQEQRRRQGEKHQEDRRDRRDQQPRHDPRRKLDRR